MSWINSRQFKISNRNGRHYVFRRNNAGNTEINIPKTITTKAEAVRWLKAHPEKVTKPKRKGGPKATGYVPVPRPRKVGAPAPLRKPYTGPINEFMYNPYSPMNVRPGPAYTSPQKPRFGYLGANAGSPRVNMSASNFKKSLTEMRPIGAGRQGRAYLASQGPKKFVLKIVPYDTLAKSRKEFQPADVEYENHRVCMNLAPQGVVKLYSHIRALNFVPENNLATIQNAKTHHNLSKQSVIVMEWCDGGTLESWLKSHNPTDSDMKKLVVQILTALRDIRKKYPYFRHNDLHLDNIFVSSKRGFLIADFGWSRLKEKGTNPAVNTANGTTTASHYGVGPKTNSRYDHHLFLNHLRIWCLKNPSRVPETLKFLNAVVPPGYRGQTDTHVSDWRLKYEDPCPGLPTINKVLGHPFLKGLLASSPELKEGRGRLIKTGRKLTPARNASPRKAPAPKPKRQYTNAELVTMNRFRLAALSPATRRRAVNLRAKAKKNEAPKKKPSPPKGAPVPKTEKRPVIPRNVLKSSKFDKMVERIWRNAGAIGNAEYTNEWNKARRKAINMVENRMMRGLPPLSISPPKVPSPPKPPKPPKVLSPPNHKLSPKSGRVKIKAPNSGRYVYANGGSVSLEYLKSLASRLQVNIKGLRSKTAIANKIFKKNK
jgi:serine/threonine protein kinase